MTTTVWIILTTIQIISCYLNVDKNISTIPNDNIYKFHLGENLNIKIETEFRQSIARCNNISIYRTRQNSCLRGRICYKIGYQSITLMGIMKPQFKDLIITNGSKEKNYKIEYYKENKTEIIKIGQMVNMTISFEKPINKAESSEALKYRCNETNEFCYEFDIGGKYVHLSGRFPPHEHFLTLFPIRRNPPYTIMFASDYVSHKISYSVDAYLNDEFTTKYKIEEVYTFPQISETNSTSCVSKQVCYRLTEDKMKFILMGRMPAYPIYISLFSKNKIIPNDILEYNIYLSKYEIVAYGQNLRIKKEFSSQINNVTSDAEILNKPICREKEICYYTYGKSHMKVEIFGKSGPQFNYFTIFGVNDDSVTHAIQLPKAVYEFESPLGEKISQFFEVRDEIKSIASSVNISQPIDGKCPDNKICVVNKTLTETKVQIKITGVMDENLKYITFFKENNYTNSILSIIYRELPASYTYEFEDKEYIDLKINLPFDAVSHSPSLVLKTTRCPEFRICYWTAGNKVIRLEGDMDSNLKYITIFSESVQRGQAYTIKFKLKKNIIKSKKFNYN